MSKYFSTILSLKYQRKNPGLVKSELGAHKSSFGESQSRSQDKIKTVLRRRGSTELRRYGELGVHAEKIKDLQDMP